MLTKSCPPTPRRRHQSIDICGIQERIEQVRSNWSAEERQRRAALSRQRQQALQFLLATSEVMSRSA